jgi:hypothetical protein
MTCTIIGLVVACSGAPVQTTPEQALALMKRHAAEVVEFQVPDRPADVTRPNTAEESLAIMKAHERKIVLVDAARRYPATTDESPRRRFGESPWWWKELYDPWWDEPWVVKPWQLQPVPEPCCGWGSPEQWSRRSDLNR